MGRRLYVSLADLGIDPTEPLAPSLLRILIAGTRNALCSKRSPSYTTTHPTSSVSSKALARFLQRRPRPHLLVAMKTASTSMSTASMPGPAPASSDLPTTASSAPDRINALRRQDTQTLESESDFNTLVDALQTTLCPHKIRHGLSNVPLNLIATSTTGKKVPRLLTAHLADRIHNVAIGVLPSGPPNHDGVHFSVESIEDSSEQTIAAMRFIEKELNCVAFDMHHYGWVAPTLTVEPETIESLCKDKGVETDSAGRVTLACIASVFGEEDLADFRVAIVTDMTELGQVAPLVKEHRLKVQK